MNNWQSGKTREDPLIENIDYDFLFHTSDASIAMKFARVVRAACLWLLNCSSRSDRKLCENLNELLLLWESLRKNY
jgi:hypothetical protein